MLEPPPVEQVDPGIWSIPVPIPNNPLGYTLVYAFDTDRGPVLVDAGWNDPATLQALDDGLQDAGFELSEVHGILVTHHHPDHHGLSGEVRDRSGAWIAMHHVEAELISRAQQDDGEYFLQTAAVLLEAGATEEDLAQLPDPDKLSQHRPPRPAVPNRLIADGERVEVPGWDVRAVWTPGHTPGHVCFVVERYQTLLAGDHVLPEISPHVGLYHEEDGEVDPLGDYLRSLRQLRELDVTEVLPAHQHRFEDLDARVRVLLEHHEERLDSIRDQLAAGPATGWEVAERMPWNRPWDQIPPMMKRAALAEALAHVRCLEGTGEVVADPSVSPTTYALAD